MSPFTSLAQTIMRNSRRTPRCSEPWALALLPGPSTATFGEASRRLFFDNRPALSFRRSSHACRKGSSSFDYRKGESMAA
jgi:hypothetical protein